MKLGLSFSLAPAGFVGADARIENGIVHYGPPAPRTTPRPATAVERQTRALVEHYHEAIGNRIPGTYRVVLGLDVEDCGGSRADAAARAEVLINDPCVSVFSAADGWEVRVFPDPEQRRRWLGW